VNNDRSLHKHKVSVMISKVKSQGKRTMELKVVGRALRPPTQGFPIHVNARQAKSLPYGIYFTHPLNSESGAVCKTHD
jgi:hypothetical protein